MLCYWEIIVWQGNKENDGDISQQGGVLFLPSSGQATAGLTIDLLPSSVRVGKFNFNFNPKRMVNKENGRDISQQAQAKPQLGWT